MIVSSLSFASCQRNSYLCQCYSTTDSVRHITQSYSMGRLSGNDAIARCNASGAVTDSCRAVELR